jgi:hypothetical protein
LPRSGLTESLANLTFSAGFRRGARVESSFPK